MGQKFCETCGAKRLVHHKFCTGCGTTFMLSVDGPSTDQLKDDDKLADLGRGASRNDASTSETSRQPAGEQLAATPSEDAKVDEAPVCQEVGDETGWDDWEQPESRKSRWLALALVFAVLVSGGLAWKFLGSNVQTSDSDIVKTDSEGFVTGRWVCKHPNLPRFGTDDIHYWGPLDIYVNFDNPSVRVKDLNFLGDIKISAEHPNGLRGNKIYHPVEEDFQDFTFFRSKTGVSFSPWWPSENNNENSDDTLICEPLKTTAENKLNDSTLDRK